MPGSKKRENDLFSALGHPMRRQILRKMLGAPQEEVSPSELSPRELAAKLSQQLSALSYHVRVLNDCNAIELVRTEQIRGSTQHFYRAIVKADWVFAALADDEATAKGRRGGRKP